MLYFVNFVFGCKVIGALISLCWLCNVFNEAPVPRLLTKIIYFGKKKKKRKLEKINFFFQKPSIIENNKMTEYKL